ncbi:MAG TPA: tetratricopeptide repeat protein, partial [Candidatus Bathyarchaeia archaeon]|nr:tetratricopeptide repeat protein [Candidatus Bathyarchaeia archaeon]
TGSLAGRSDWLGLFDSFRKKFSSKEEDERSSLSRKIQDSPQDPQARQKLGLFLLRQGEIVEGTDQLARAAILYEKSGFTTKAIAVLRQMLKNDPANIEFQRWLIRLLAQHGHTGDALSELQKVASGGIRFASDDQRIEFYQGISENLPGNALPSLLVADVYLYQRKLFEAVSEMAKVVSVVFSSRMEKEFAVRMNVLTSLAIENPELFEPCGFLWIAAGNPEEGLPYLQKAVNFLGSSGDSSRSSAADEVVSAVEKGQAEKFAGAMSFEDALHRLSEPELSAPAEGKKAPPREGGEDEKVLQNSVEKLQAKVKEEIGESDPEARYNLGIAYKEMGLLDEAAEEFRISRLESKLFLGASCLLAETLAEKGEFEAATETLKEVLAVEGVSPAETRDVRYLMAVLFTQSGKEEEAREIFLSLYESYPNYRDLRERIRKFGE